MTADATQKKPVIRKLNDGKLKRAEFERTIYRVTLNDGTTLEDVLKPEHWAHVGKKLRPFDIIEIIFNDGQRYVELIVVDCANLWAKVAVKSDTDLRVKKTEAEVKREAAADDLPYKVEYKGPSAKWSVIRKSDNERVQDGFGTRDEAQKWQDDYIKTLAA